MPIITPSSHGGGAATPPFHAAPTGTTAIMVDSPDGDPIIGFDADAPAIDAFYDWDFGGHDIANAGTVNGNALGPAFTYVTDTDAAPTTYVTPLVFDHTALTGGLYAWDGSAYVQVGGPLA